jgi:hypothetical protein
MSYSIGTEYHRHEPAGAHGGRRRRHGGAVADSGDGTAKRGARELSGVEAKSLLALSRRRAKESRAGRAQGCGGARSSGAAGVPADQSSDRPATLAVQRQGHGATPVRTKEKSKGDGVALTMADCRLAGVLADCDGAETAVPALTVDDRASNAARTWCRARRGYGRGESKGGVAVVVGSPAAALPGNGGRGAVLRGRRVRGRRQ